jgi:phytoene synthase
MITFYAFCRVVDDIADDPALPMEDKRETLAEWRHGLVNGFTSPDELQAELAELPKRYNIDPALLTEIIDGVESDLKRVRYETFEGLLSYCYKVACVVGLVSIEIFGYKNPLCREYAVNLGYALQLTNIIRDVGEDARNEGRIYLPLEDLRRFGVTEDEIMKGTQSPRFTELMKFQYERANDYYERARSSLPAEDRSHMISAELMGKIYHEILEKIARGGFDVLHQRIGLSKLRKLSILASYRFRGWLMKRPDDTP